MRRILLVGVTLHVVGLLVLPSLLGKFMGGSTSAVPGGVHRKDLTVHVYFPDSQKVQDIPLNEYLIGVVAAEMPPEFETAALKAQFVVARTYTVRRMHQFVGPGKGGCPLHPSADVCADPGTGQAFTTLDEAAAKMGRTAAQAYWRRLAQASRETEGLVLTYDGGLADPLYHSVSGRSTEDAGEYFSQDVPYLKPVDDHWGAYSPKFLDTRRMSPEAVARAFAVQGRPVVQIVSRTASGRVKTVRVSGNLISGRAFRERLELRSTDFTVSQENGQFVIQTRGYGHGVGMSQYGANGMALEGRSYQQILEHYYKGTRLSSIFSE